MSGRGYSIGARRTRSGCEDIEYQGPRPNSAIDSILNRRHGAGSSALEQLKQEITAP